MNYRDLGKTGLRVSEVGFGAWAIGGNSHGNSYGPTDDKTSISAIRKALELGCNFFDTADVYGHGHSEDLLGHVLKDNRDKVVIATKVGGDFYHSPPRMNFNSDYVEFAVEKSLQRLRTDRIDLYQLHNPPIPLLENPDLYKVFDKLKKAGKIQHYGISIHDPQEGMIAMRAGGPESIQVVFNILRQEAKNELFDAARENDTAIIAREPLANGFLTGKHGVAETFPLGDIRHHFPREYLLSLIAAAEKLSFLEAKDRTLAQAAIRFVLDCKEVSTVIPGAKTPKQTEDNLKASSMLPLTGEEHLRIRLLREQGFA